ncbi:MAG: ABC transporter permease [Defluviitaleaceae bacterium]|nr:ABC transporter permease [Defluviitaleaceae bacterium]
MERILRKFPKPSKGTLMFFGGLAVAFVVWHFASLHIDQAIRLPNFVTTMQAFFTNWTNSWVMENLGITLWRVLRGVGYASLIGLPLGMFMGYSKTIRQAISPLMNSIRQIPIMAWVPMAILWFGLGEGPTLFIIFMSAVFPLMINTLSGVMNIDPNYISAAKSMGASTLKIFVTIILPGAFPSFLTGLRMAVGLGWMSVICAEFIATSSGFGFLLIQAQIQFRTADLWSLMIMAAVTGYFIDRILLLVERSLTSWRFKDAAEN